jgi:hypothetical protein
MDNRGIRELKRILRRHEEIIHDYRSALLSVSTKMQEIKHHCISILTACPRNESFGPSETEDRYS